MIKRDFTSSCALNSYARKVNKLINVFHLSHRLMQQNKNEGKLIVCVCVCV